MGFIRWTRNELIHNPQRALDHEPLEYSRLSLTVVLWSIAIAVMIADIGTSYIGLHAGFPELNPIGKAAIAGFGFWGIVPVKLTALAIGIGSWQMSPNGVRKFIPIALAAPWGYAAIHNVLLLVTL